MDMTEIDRVIAEDLQSGDTFKNTDEQFITVSLTETDGDLIKVYDEDEPDGWPYVFVWDEYVILYGYTD